MSIYSLSDDCRQAIEKELGIYCSCKTPRGSHICDIWISDANKEKFEKAFIEGNAGDKYGLNATYSYNVFGKKTTTYAMSRKR